MESNQTKEIFDYWLKIYPEKKDINELDDYMKICFDKSLEEKLCEAEIDKEFIFNEMFSDSIFSEEERGNIRFYYFYQPILSEYMLKINSFICICKMPISKSILKELAVQLLNKLNDLAFQVIVYEINNERKAGQLVGKTSEQRYVYYTNYLLRDNRYRKKLYRKYNYLMEMMVETSEDFVKYVKEIIGNTESYLELIKEELFESKDEDKLVSMDLSMGDAHFRGKSATKLVFSSNQIIYYKPRDCRIDRAYQKVLELLNNTGVLNDMNLRTMKVVCGCNCGWFENIKYGACESEEQLVSYYKKIGEIMAIMYFFGATDLHYENIIAACSDPVVIDLESIIGAHIKQQVFNENSGFYRAIDKIRDSVSAIGILPSKLHIGQNKEGFDVSGIGDNSKQLSPVKSMAVIDDGTDEIKLKMVNTYIDKCDNLPNINGNQINASGYKSELISGFESVYKWVIENKELFADIINKEFAQTKTRIVLKPTFLYAQISLFARHPMFLTSKKNHEMFVARIGVYSRNEDITKSEIKTLNYGEIPYFYARFEERSIYDDMNNKMETSLAKSPMEVVTEKINNASEKDMEFQKRVIKSSFFKIESCDLRTGLSFNKQRFFVDSSAYLNTAREIGDWLCKNAVIGHNENGNEDAVWIGSNISKVDINDWSLEVSPLELYNGNAGIALYLLTLWNATKNSEYLFMAQRAIVPIINVVDNKTLNYNQLVGAFDGVGSYLYVMAKFYEKTKSKLYYDTINKMLDLIPDKINETEEMDIIAGNAGMLAALIKNYQILDDKAIKGKLENLMQLICEKIENAISKSNKILKYSGFAHGVAGCIAILYKLYCVNRNQRVYEIFKKLLNYERNVMFDNNRQIWLTELGKDGYSKAWCHGFPGILLEKIMLKQMGYSDTLLDNEINLAITKVIDECIGNNLVYCHGDMGNLDILLFAAQVIENSDLEEMCRVTYNTLYEDVIKRYWNDDGFSASKCMGIMMGLSGIGMSLLRFCRRVDTSNFLALE
ncbi:MAG: type 2 lantipeptide synthetase LanM [Lachnospiraceae bacterium]|nr:type 2 lantipeptide synthetase LanM [Lachnospiraceae bacterium]